MERPPLVARTRVITTVEDELIELQRDTDADYYEPLLVEQRRAGRREVLDLISKYGVAFAQSEAQLKEWGL